MGVIKNNSHAIYEGKTKEGYCFTIAQRQGFPECEVTFKKLPEKLKKSLKVGKSYDLNALPAEKN